MIDQYETYYKLKEWQDEHRHNGYHVERLSAGQVRAYGPTVYEYIIIDLKPYSYTQEQVVREYCLTQVHKADDPLRHSLIMHLIEFKRIGPNTYYYKCGHDWDG